MNIFIPTKLKDIGGIASFSKKFATGMKLRGHHVTFNPKSTYDVMLVLASCERRYLWDAWRKKKTVVQRLDGIFYPTTISGWLYPFYNLTPQFIHRFLSSYTIYQSKYSRYACERFLGKRNDDRATIIYNGIDTHHFSPEGAKRNLRDHPRQTVFVTASKFRRKDQILPILEALELYAHKYTTDFKFIVAGSFSGPVACVPKLYSNRPWLTFVGKINNEELPHYYRDADVFLFTHQNPPCPNNVIEAMACGLPICGVSDGAMSELTTPGINSELIHASGTGFFKSRHLDTAAFADNLSKIMKNLEHYSKNSRRIAVQHFRLEPMLDQYESTLAMILA